MKTPTAIALAIALLAVPALAQDGEGQPDPRQDVVQKLREIEKLMREIENDLARAGVRPDPKNGALEDLVRQELAAGRSPEEVRKKIEEMMKGADQMRQAGESADKIRAEIERLMGASGEGAGRAAEQIEKLLREQGSIDQATKRLEEIIKTCDSAGQAVSKIDELMKEAGARQGDAVEKIQKIIDSAKPGQGQGDGQPDKPQPKPEPKPEDGEQPKDPHNSEKEKPREEDERPDPLRPESKRQPTREIPPKTERWGDMPDKTFPRSGSGEDESMPEKYRRLIEAYRNSLRGSVRGR